MARQERIEIEGRALEVTNLDKVLYPETGTTKGDVLAYYLEVADLVIAHAQWRPATVRRWVNGVGTRESPVKGFFQKNLGADAPDWVKTFSLEHSEKSNCYPLVNDAATLAWLAQLAALEIHTPQWRFGPRGAQRKPDRLVIDLDPGEGVDLEQCAWVARIVRSWLRREGIEPVPVTSGSKGIHLYARVDGTRSADALSELARECARAIEAEHSDLVVSDMSRMLRAGKVFIDWSQNNASKTTVAPYSLRGTTRPMVAFPRDWGELATPKLQHVELGEALEIIRGRFSDPLARLSTPDESAAGEGKVESIKAHRRSSGAARRRASGSDRRGRSGGRTDFVIQEHQARRHHYDLRIERDGVLVSWALPSGVPVDPRKNRLAVHTEDHPLSYATFEGTIPRGGYGAGLVRIWDKGNADVRTWREDDEVVVTLHGVAEGGLGGARTFALIHTGHEGRDADHWLMHLMAPDSDAPAKDMPYRPMLVSRGSDEAVRGRQWRYEMKWDGIRAICDVRGGSARVWSRNGTDLTPNVARIAADLPLAVSQDCILDGEIIALDHMGRPNFGRLQTLLGGSRTSHADEDSVMSLMLFDLLEVDGAPLLDLPYEDRRARLERLVDETGVVHLPPAYDRDLDEALSLSRSLGLEGVVAKRADSVYHPGLRSPAWVKLKFVRMQEVVIVGWSPNSEDRLGSVVLGVPAADGAGLRYAGRVGTGMSTQERDELEARFKALERATPPLTGVPKAVARSARWVRPQLVAEVRFTEWTRAGVMRHPVWRGVRRDKSPAEVQPPELT